MIRNALFCTLLFVLLGSGCTGSPPPLPYPAFVQVDELEDVFMASLPGVRAKPLAGDARTRRGSYRIDFPPGWSGTSGASPGRALELYVLEGVIQLADIELGSGGYAYLPSGSLGFNLRSPAGGRVMYFLSDVDPDTVIRTPIIIDTAILPWEPSANPGVALRELRRDPGSGATTWLLRVKPQATLPWQSSSAAREGYLVAGQFRDSECRLGQTHTGIYQPGGYFLRPPGAVHGGPQATAIAESIWLLRERSAGTVTVAEICGDAAPAQR